MTAEENRYVRMSIEAVCSRFRQAPNVFLTEDDLRVHLCSHLLQHFGTEQLTQDGDISISLHTEVRWYGKGNLKSRSDIVLVDVSNLDVLRHARMPSKGYGFNIPKAIIELKFRRPNGESQRQFLKEIQDDIGKLRQLKQVFHDPQKHFQTEFWMVILDKKEDVKGFINEPAGIQVEYVFSNQRRRESEALDYIPL
jgi:hypothetical protein